MGDRDLGDPDVAARYDRAGALIDHHARPAIRLDVDVFDLRDKGDELALLTRRHLDLRCRTRRARLGQGRAPN